MANEYRDTYIAGLVNARALETEAIQILSRQVDRLENYPEMEAALRRHIAESEVQRDRLDELLEGLGTSGSGLKDLATGLAANIAAIGHALMPDEVLKNAMANYAFEHYEIAAYRSLITLAELAGHGSAHAALDLSLREEERMAQWCHDNLDAVTRRYATLRAQGQKAGV
ncbi:ferritin-like domain-containing protein [Falsiroseomonas selenitidurans]|uniref:Ferritin-like domain-containing protein n=1 Tax=Falsiroseomonas selenitidurans TaxID=2716335 RepID=A0ABX1DYX1_9PROT|nr:ferritin-like domain-containing protein [Falsiroseomonas selenitidurans]NKC30109.1 ferritin-like domain-containing protein [Falsiroseomonas selenitidurans]